ncbi:MAG: DUF192 domain-containing protein [Burkholderiales bacterium]|nr:DUF192 domain-containing protein [Burkholderiales bacterium]
MKRWLSLLLFAFAATAVQAQAPAQGGMPLIELKLGKHALTAEVAGNDPDRMQGLMHRRMLPENRGMLFVFRDVAHHGMWMMNTYIPLSVAFIDEAGVIVNIEDMQPHTRDSHTAKKPVRYALEMNQGWFRKRGIGPGMKIEGLERAPPPR